MAWCFEDASSQYDDGVLDMFVDSVALVPSIWPLEVANVLLVSERRKRMSKADSLRFVSLLHELPITIDQPNIDRAFSDVISVAREQGLSSYDAAYLELAMREGVPLATGDDALKRAARRCGVKIL